MYAFLYTRARMPSHFTRGAVVDCVLAASDVRLFASPPLSDRDEITCFRCGEKGHWSRDCPQSAKNQMQQKGEDEGILNRNRSELRGRDARMYDKALLEKRERAHYGR